MLRAKDKGLTANGKRAISQELMANNQKLDYSLKAKIHHSLNDPILIT